MLWAFAMSIIVSIVAGHPNEWTGIISPVFPLIACSIADGLMLIVSRSMSTKVGTRSCWRSGDTTVVNVAAGTITSIPFCRMPALRSALIARRFADDPELTATPYCVPI